MAIRSGKNANRHCGIETYVLPDKPFASLQTPDYTIAANAISLEGNVMPTKTKMAFIDEIAAKNGTPKRIVRTIVHQFLDEIVSELAKGNRLEFRDFGVFEVRERKPRKAQNPKTMEPVQVPAKRVVKFKAGRGMREGVNGLT